MQAIRCIKDALHAPELVMSDHGRVAEAIEDRVQLARRLVRVRLGVPFGIGEDRESTLGTIGHRPLLVGREIGRMD